MILQHRELAEGKGPGIPISPEEVELVKAARKTQDPRMSLSEWLELCRLVSLLALKDSKKATATLKYTFGAEHFQDRVRAVQKDQMAGGLQQIAAAFFPKREPAKAPKADRPRWRLRTRPLPPPPAETDPELIRILEETQSNLANRGWVPERAGEQPEQEPQQVAQAAPEPPQSAPEPPPEPPRPEPQATPQTPPEERQRASAPQDRRTFREWLNSLCTEDKIAAMEGRLTMPGAGAAA